MQTTTDVKGWEIDTPQDLNLTYSISQGCTAGVQHVRMGNTSEGVINITVLKDVKVMRYVPVAAGGTTHAPLAIVDELQPGTEIYIAVAAEGSGKLILDVGIL